MQTSVVCFHLQVSAKQKGQASNKKSDLFISFVCLESSAAEIPLAVRTVTSLVLVLAFAAAHAFATEATETPICGEQDVTAHYFTLCVRSAYCTDAAVYVVAFVQDVDGTKADGQLFVRQEALADAAVPDETVGVHRGIGIASAALLLDVAADGHAPGCGDDETSAIGEVLVVEVRGSGIVAAVEVITEVAVGIELHLPFAFPVSPIGETHPFVEVCTSGVVLHCGFVPASVEVAYALRCVYSCVCIDAPILVLVQCGVEVEGTRRIPVAVHIDRH